MNNHSDVLFLGTFDKQRTLRFTEMNYSASSVHEFNIFCVFYVFIIPYHTIVASLDASVAADIGGVRLDSFDAATGVALRVMVKAVASASAKAAATVGMKGKKVYIMDSQMHADKISHDNTLSN